MADITDKIVNRVQNRMLGELTKHIEQQSAQIEDLTTKLMIIHKDLQRTQLEINHNQLELHQDTNRQVKNSGYMQVSDNEIVAKIFSGLKMYLDPRDIAVVPHIVLDSVWEHQITSAWLSVIRPNDVVVDIGANFGYFGVLAAQKTDKKKSKVIFFEANPNLIPYLRKTLAVNWFNEQSIIENLAITDKKGDVTLNILKDYIGSSSIHSIEELDAYMHDKMYLEVEEKVSVKSTSLDRYCENNRIKKVDLIKMDIEGYEEIAYKGMTQVIENSPDLTLFVEFTKEGYKAPEQFYQKMLDDFGHVYLIDGEGYIFKPDKTEYGAVVGNSDDWVMPIFSKRSNLANKSTGLPKRAGIPKV